MASAKVKYHIMLCGPSLAFWTQKKPLFSSKSSLVGKERNLSSTETSEGLHTTYEENKVIEMTLSESVF